MKILHVIDKLDIGGAERVFLDIVSLLREKGMGIGALVFDSSGKLTAQIDKHVKFFDLRRSNKFSILKMWQLHRICSDYDIVHVHLRHCFKYARLVQLIFGGQYKLVLHDHYGNIVLDKSVPLGLRFPFKPAYYIGVSTTLTDWAVRTLGMPLKDVYLLRNIVRPAVKAYDVPPGNRNAMMVGNIRRMKNIGFAVGLFKKLGWTLDIYGNLVDPDYIAELKPLLEGSKNIQIITGISDFAQRYNNYTIAIHCARSESGPLVLIEYLAAGIPFVAYKTGEVSEIIYKDLPLLFMDTFDENDWICRINDIIGTRGLPEKMREVFHRYFSPEKYVAECMNIYERISC